jgi:hypothetical protein
MQSQETQSQKKNLSHGAPTHGTQQIADISLPQPTKNTIGSGEETAGKWAMLAIVAIGIFMATLDSSIVNITLPTEFDSIKNPGDYP